MKAFAGLIALFGVTFGVRSYLVQPGDGRLPKALGRSRMKKAAPTEAGGCRIDGAQDVKEETLVEVTIEVKFLDTFRVTKENSDVDCRQHATVA